MNSKRIISIICIVMAVCAILAAVGLTIFAINKMNSPTIKIESVESFSVRYSPDLDTNDFYVIHADINEGKITVKRFTGLDGGKTLSGTDTVSASDMQEVSRTFRTDLTEIEKYIIEHSEDFLVDDHEYDFGSSDGYEIICDMTLAVNGSEYLHMEWLTKLPDNWSDFIDTIWRVSGFTL